MKRFLLKTCFFVLLLSGIILIFLQGTSIVVNKNADFVIDLKPKYLILGSSQSECAYNDSIIPDSKNMSQSGESFFYTYLKAKKLLVQNSSIQVVFIDFSNIQVSSLMNDWTWDDKHLSFRYPIYSSFMNFNDQLLLFKNNPISLISSLSFSLKYRLKRIVNNDFKFLNEVGGYLYLDRNKTDSLLMVKDKSFKTTDNINTKHTISETNIFYLERLINECNNQNKKVYLIRSPQHSNSLNYSNEALYIDLLNNRFKNIEYLDFSKVPFKNSEFADLDHLNYKGAKSFSLFFSKLLEDSLLFKENKQKCIDIAILKKETNF